MAEDKARELVERAEWMLRDQVGTQVERDIAIADALSALTPPAVDAVPVFDIYQFTPNIQPTPSASGESAPAKQYHAHAENETCDACQSMTDEERGAATVEMFTPQPATGEAEEAARFVLSYIPAIKERMGLLADVDDTKGAADCLRQIQALRLAAAALRRGGVGTEEMRQAVLEVINSMALTTTRDGATANDIRGWHSKLTAALSAQGAVEALRSRGWGVPVGWVPADDNDRFAYHLVDSEGNRPHPDYILALIRPNPAPVSAPTAEAEGVFSPFNACCYRDECRANARALRQPAGEVRAVAEKPSQADRERDEFRAGVADKGPFATAKVCKDCGGALSALGNCSDESCVP